VFTFPLDPDELFEERARQFAGWGIPQRTIAAVRSEVSAMWSEEEGGWTPSWLARADAARRRERWLEAALCCGAAKFPVVATPLRERAYEQQIRNFERAAGELRLSFERREVPVPYREGTTGVVMHTYSRRGRPARAALMLCGGVDTWKIELHRLATLLVRATGLAVVAVDMPGTGESKVPLAPDSDQILSGALATATEALGVNRAGFFGISFGGHWAAKLALKGAVDAAVDLGGPVAASFEREGVDRLPHGMTGIVANAAGFDRVPPISEVRELLREFSLPPDLARTGGSPLLVVNGTADPYVPASDATIFESRPQTAVWLIRDGEHCAADRIRRVMPAIFGWIARELAGGWRAETLARLAKLPLRPLLVGPPDLGRETPPTRTQRVTRHRI
jgi:esterase FrsA